MALRSALVACLVTMCAFDAYAQTTRLYVLNEETTAGGSNTNCLLGPGTNGSSPEKPLREDDKDRMDGLAQAIRCANNYPGTTENFEIIVLCSKPTPVGSQSYCTYVNDSLSNGVGEFTLTKSAPVGKRYSIRGTPARMVRVVPNSANVKAFRLEADRWTIEGLTFDGDWNYRGKSFISITGSDIRFQQNTVMQSRGTCINIAPDSADGTAPTALISDVWIRNNTIAGCYDHREVGGVWGFEQKDIHCIHNTHADKVTVENNDISDCQGDGFQNEMYLPKLDRSDCAVAVGNLQLIGAGSEDCQRPKPYYTSDVAENTRIIGNRFWTACRTFKTGALAEMKKWTIGEDAIDIKRTGAGLRIANNRIWGRRSFPNSSSAFFECQGTGSQGGGTGTGGGGGIVLHGNIEGPCLSPDADPPTDESRECAVIEGNEIFDNQGGISVGEQADTPTENNVNGTGRPRGVVIRGNYIHDLRGNGLRVQTISAGGTEYLNTELDVPPRARGRAFSFSTGQDTGRDYWNRVYRNTLVNIPGHPLEFAPATRRFKVVNNIVSYTAGPYVSLEIAAPNPSCKIQSTVDDKYVVNEPDNFWFKSLKPGGGLTSLFIPPGFIQLWGGGLTPQPSPTQTQPALFDGTTNCGATPSSWVNPIGITLHRDTVQSIPDFENFSGQYDYRLNNTDTPWTSPIDPPDHANTSTAPLYVLRHRDHGANCGTRPEFGADEQCDRSRVFVREVKEPSEASRDAEIYSGPGEYLWRSPDVGIGVGSDKVTWDISDAADGDLPSDPAIVEGDTTPQPTRLFVRIRTTSVAGATQKLMPGDTVRVRIHGGPAHVESRFPATVEPLVDTEVIWREATVCTTNCNDLLGRWNWHPGGTASVQVFSFPWTPRGARTEQGTIAPKSDEHYCLLAEVSADRDRSPPTFVNLVRSNNLAQRNVLVTRFPAEIGKVGFFIEGEMNGPEGNPGSIFRYDELMSKQINVDTKFSAARPSYLFFPSAPAFDYTNDGSTTFPPEGRGQIIILQPGLNKLAIDRPNLGRRYAEILVDNRGLPPPDETEYVQISSSTGGLTHYLNAPNLVGESFELLQSSGLPSGWEKYGMWRTVDQYSAPTCGAAAFGRKSIATNNLSTCTYDTGARVTSVLESPTIYWNANSVLEFKNWSETERFLNYDVRRVTIVIMEGTLPVREVELARWSGSDAGSRDNWVRERFSLAPHWVTNSRIKIKFHFDTVDSLYNNYAGWYIDDIEVK